MGGADAAPTPGAVLAAGASTPACRAIASAPSRITTSSKVVQPINCTMFSTTGSRAKLLP